MNSFFNGRMSRLLTTLLLYRSGCHIGRCISLETKIAERKRARVAGLDYSGLSVERFRASNRSLINSGRCEIARILEPNGSLLIVNEAAGFDRVTTYHHDSKPWITVMAEKGEAAKSEITENLKE